jgi:ornithine cyclodeaminase/alanine dehydrogenase-like protein (mu-crystallin family)
MPVTFRLLTESDVKAVLSMDDLIEAMSSALERFSTGHVTQPVRTVIPIEDDAFAGFMPAFVRRGGVGRGGLRSASLSGERNADAAGESNALGAKLVTVFGRNHARGLPSHLASIVLMDPDTGALLALLDGRYITEARTAAVSAVSSRQLAPKGAAALAIIGSGVQARSHLDALSRVHALRQVRVWSPNKNHRDAFVVAARDGLKAVPYVPAGTTSGDVAGTTPRDVEHGLQAVPQITATDRAGEAVAGADVIVLATSSPTPVIEDGWVRAGAHVISVGACRPNQREMDPALVARARLFVDSRAAALVESGDVVMGMHEQIFGADHIAAELGEVVNGATGRRTDAEVTIFKSLGLAVEDVTAADLAYRRALDRGVGQALSL